MTSLALDTRHLALDLYGLLREIDPPRWRDDLEAGFRERLARIDARITSLLSASWPGGASIRDRLAELHEIARRYAPQPGTVDPRAAWRTLQRALQPAYEQFANSLREWDLHVPHLRPSNPARSLLHVGSAGGIIALVELALHSQARMLAVAGGAALLAWTFEVTRRTRPRWNEVLMRAFGPTSHPHERHRVNSATWYTTALFVLAVIGSIPAGVAGVAILGLGDPAAALIGRRFGRIKLLHGRTLEGTLAFVVAGFVAALAVLLGLHPEIATGAAIAMAATASVTGATAELLARRVDDNLSIPVVAGATAWLTGLALGAL